MTCTCLTRPQARCPRHGSAREALMRIGVLALSERRDGCLNATAAARIRQIVSEMCWPGELTSVRDFIDGLRPTAEHEEER